MKTRKNQFGVLSDGTKVSLFTVSNGKVSFSLTDYGATITSIQLTSEKTKTDVVLGYSTLDGYINGDLFFGATVARFANRIAGGVFSLDGVTYTLDKNNGGNCLHSGYMPSNKMMWQTKFFETKKSAGVKCTKIFEDGEQGFPGRLKVTVSYELDDKNKLHCVYEAVTDRATPVNITNHSYFNLSGNGTVTDHILKLNCKSVLEIDDNMIPTGKFIDVKGTPFDFLSEKKIGKDISKVGMGYDHCYVTEMYDKNDEHCALPCSGKKLVRAAELSAPDGKKMTVDTNMEGVQIYTANFIEGKTGKNGRIYHAHDAVCFETQCFPDSPNKRDFPSCVLFPGRKYRAVTIFGFDF